MATEKTNIPVPEEQVGHAEDVNIATPTPEETTAAGQDAAPAKADESPVTAGSSAAVTADQTQDGEADATETVDFGDEDAALAASQPDLDMGEDTEEELAQAQRSDADTVRNLEDISRLDKQQLVELFASLLASKPVQQIRREAEAVKVAFYKLHRAEHDQRKREFAENGGAPEDFVPQTDPEEAKLKELFAEYRRRRADYLANMEKEKEENLRIKLQIIEELKELVSGNETMNSTFNTFRELQQRWRDTGIVPQANVKELWETYNLHVENFYNYIKINKELRDLDLKRNYEAKLQLCEAAEALMLEPSIVTAFRKLQDLHDQWRETGPVANEYKEALWERFKEASTRINKQHQEYFEKLKEEQKRNLDLKTELCIKVEELSSEILTTRKEWNKASDRLIEIQKVWKTIGFAPQKDNAKIYERFRNACDRFFEQKREFYEQLKTEMDANLQLKNEICEQAESLQDSEQWKKTTDELIALQKRWKEIGPVPRRYSDAVWKRFRAACDRFFQRKTAHFSGVDEQHDQNLRLKLALLDEMEAADIREGGFDMIKEFQRRWNEIGFVPIKRKEDVQKRYKEIVDTMFSTLRGGERERSMDRFRSKVSGMKTTGDKRLRFERDRLYNRVKQLEGDIATLENNIGFFARSKNAETMIREVEQKIEKAKQEMAETIEKIKVIDSQQEQGEK